MQMITNLACAYLMRLMVCFAALLPNLLYGQLDFDVFPTWKNIPNPSNNLYELFLDEATTSLAARDRKIRGLSTKEEWIQRQNFVRNKLLDLIGAFPEKTSLRPIITGRIEREKYHIEKLHFQSRPEFYVTAALFVPKGIAFPAPAILFCSGHSQEGFRSATYQHMILNYVQKGFVVFAFDPVGQGERLQYFDADGEPYLRPTLEHSRAGNQVFITGISPANYFIWDGIRALDYLVDRPEVDVKRIGVTGRSGGGTQAAYLMALDDRIYAAAPECYLTTFDKLMKSRGPQDAEQNIKHFLTDFDLPDLVQVRAPKPTLVITTTRDIFSIAGARDLFMESKRAFATLSATDHLAMVEDHAGHESTKKNREAAYAFFRKHLNNPGPIYDEPVDTFDLRELWVTNTGQVTLELHSETVFSLNQQQARQLAAERKVALNDPRAKSQLLEKVAALINWKGSDLTIETIYSGTTTEESIRIDRYLLAGSKGYYLPVVKMMGEDTSGKTILLLDELGKSNQAQQGSEARHLIEAGHIVYLADLSGFGEMSGGYQGGDARLREVPINVWYAGILVDQNPISIRIQELTWVQQFIATDKPASSEIHLIGKGVVGIDLLHAVTMGLSFASTTLIEPLISFQSILDTEDYHPKYIMSSVAGSQAIYDLQDLTKFCDNLSIINPVDARGNIVAQEVADDLYGQLTHESSVSIDPNWDFGGWLDLTKF